MGQITLELQILNTHYRILKRCIQINPDFESLSETDKKKNGKIKTSMVNAPQRERDLRQKKRRQEKRKEAGREVIRGKMGRRDVK